MTKKKLEGFLSLIVTALFLPYLHAQDFDRLVQEHIAAGRHQKAAETLLAKAENARKVFGENHISVAHALMAHGTVVYQYMGDLNTAAESFSRAGRIAKESGDDRLYLQALTNIGQITGSVGEHLGSAFFFEEAEKVATRIWGAGSDGALHQKLSRADQLRVGGKPSEAAELYSEILPLARRGRLNGLLDPVILHLRLASSYADADRYMEANRHTDIFLQLLEKHGHPHASRLDGLFAAASVKRISGYHEEAIRYFEAALRLVGDEGRSEVGATRASIVEEIGRSLLQAGRFSDAIAWIEQHLTESLTFDERSRLISLQATVHSEIGELVTARDLFAGLADEIRRRNIPLMIDPRNPAEALDVFGALSKIYGLLGDRESILRNARDLQEYTDRLYSGQPILQVIPLNRVSVALNNGGDHENAIRIAERALEIRRAELGENHSDVGASAEALAGEQISAGQSEKAEKMLDLAERIYRGVGANPQDRYSFMQWRAFCSEALGRREEAIDYAALAVRAAIAEAGPDSDLVLLIRHQLSLLLDNEQRFDDALRELDAALAINNRSLATVPRAQLLEEKAEILRAQGKTDASHRVLEEAIEARVRFLKTFLRESSMEERLNFLRDRRWLDPYLRSGDGLIIARILLETKGVILDSLLREARIASTVPEGRRLLSELRSMRGRLGALNSRTQNTDDLYLSAQKELLEERIAGIERELAKSGSRTPAAADGPELSLENVTGALEANEVIIEYVEFQASRMDARSRKLGALILGADSETRWVECGLISEIEETRKRLKRVVENPKPEWDGETSEILRKLYSLVFRPLAGHLGEGRERLLIAPDSIAHLLPFAALLDRDDRFLCQDFELVHIANSRALLSRGTGEGSSEGDGNRSAVLIGVQDFRSGPVSGGGPSRTMTTMRALQSLAGLSLPPLPGTRREVESAGATLSEAGWQPRVIAGREARESAVREAGRPRLLHIATHGIYLSDSEETNPSARAMRGPRPELSGSPKQPSVAENPVVSSGLLFYGIGDTLEKVRNGRTVDPDDDGILYASEIAALDANGVELVVLSACESGLGGVETGEGVFGLSRAFVQAGARDMIHSLWSLGDDEAMSFMRGFYRNIGVHEGFHRAMAETQRETLVELRQSKGINYAVFSAAPFVYWASFLGEERK